MLVAVAAGINAEEVTDSMNLQDVVVTGTRNATDVRYLPMTVSVIGRQTLTEQDQTSVLPTAMQQVPGLFVTSRSMLGYGVSGGAAGHQPAGHHWRQWSADGTHRRSSAI